MKLCEFLREIINMTYSSSDWHTGLDWKIEIGMDKKTKNVICLRLISIVVV